MIAESHLVQVTDADWARHGEWLAAEHPDVRWLLVDAESLTVLEPGGEQHVVDWDDASPTVAWFGFDGLRSPAQRRHFQLAATSPSLRFALTSYAGLDNDYWTGLHDAGVLVTNAHLSGVPMSQFILARVLEWYHQPSKLAETRAQRGWQHQPYREIDGSSWVVVGLGAIGSNVARRAKAFGAHVVGVRRDPAGTPPMGVDETVAYDELHSVVERADVIVFAVPDSELTRDLVDREFLTRTRPDAALVNVGRGSLIVEDDLLEALDDGRLGVAILDVARTEPVPDDHRFWTHPGVMLSPHTSAGGMNRHERSRDLFSSNLRRIFSGEEPETPFF